MKALQLSRDVPRLGIARFTSAVAPLTTARLSPLALRDIDDPPDPGPGWHKLHVRMAGICGSDLAMLEGKASTYFDDFVSFPLVPGHEIVGQLDNGDRVVLEPVLGHAARGLALPFDGARPADGNDYVHLSTTSPNGVEAGLQTGFCCSTGGGWATWLWAHESQLHRIEDAMPDERAVLVEPLAGGIHAALMAWPTIAPVIERGDTPTIAIIGAGTMGLAALAGITRYLPQATVIVGGRYPHQLAYAKVIGADVVCAAPQLDRAVRRSVGCAMIGDPAGSRVNGNGDVPHYLSSGADVTIDAVGSSGSISDALRITRPRGRIVMMGMPSDVSLDLTGLWHRETELKGAYTYGTETLPDGSTASTFDLAIDTANHFEAERLVSATYPLNEHDEAIAHASAAGRRGAIKIAFDLRDSLSKEAH